MVTKIKCSADGLKSSMDETGSELEDKTIEFIQFEQQRETD